MVTRKLCAPLCAVLLLTVACGIDPSSDDASDQPDAAAGEPPPESDGTRSETFEDDLALATAAVLTLDDLPTGWSSEPRRERDDDSEFDQEFADCMGVPVEEFTESTNPRAESETFVAEDETEVEAEVVLAETVADAIDAFEMATSPAFLDCMRSVLPAVMESSAEDAGGEVEITDASVGPLRIEESGERSAAFRMSISTEIDSFSVDVYFDILIAQVGRSTIQVTTTSVFSTPDVTFSRSLLDVMVERIDPDAVS